MKFSNLMVLAITQLFLLSGCADHKSSLGMEDWKNECDVMEALIELSMEVIEFEGKTRGKTDAELSLDEKIKLFELSEKIHQIKRFGDFIDLNKPTDCDIFGFQLPDQEDGLLEFMEQNFDVRYESSMENTKSGMIKMLLKEFD